MSQPVPITPLHRARETRLATLQHRFEQHRRAFPDAWCDYGSDDPIRDAERLGNPCDACGAMPRLIGDGTTWTATCDCGARAPAARMRWQAWLQWNRSPLSTDPEWHSLPFFFLAGLDAQQARGKLAQLREHLELRANLEGARRVCGRSVGASYLQRLKAYHGWCCYAQELLKRQAPAVAATADTARHATR